MIKKTVLSLFLFYSVFVDAQSSQPVDSLLFEDHFSTPDISNWIIEKSPGDSEIVRVKDGRLLIDTYGGATIWYKNELSGNIMISYKRKVIMSGGKNDRLSDLNQFWMATDPNPTAMFKRSGGFAEYDSLNMYYVGMGGNYNKTTRFRKYHTGDKEIITEYADSAHLLEANKEYFIEIRMKDGLVEFSIDGIVFFSWRDPNPFTHGYFGIRSTRSRQEIDDVKIYQLR